MRLPCCRPVTSRSVGPLFPLVSMNTLFLPAWLGGFAAVALTALSAEPLPAPLLPPAHHAVAGTSRVVITAEVLAGLAAELRTNHPALRASAARANAAQLDAAGVRRFMESTLVRPSGRLNPPAG